MDKIVEALSSPVWWLSVVVAGIVVNLVAAYGKPYIDKLLAVTSSRWRARSNAAKEKRERFIAQLRSDPNEFQYQSVRELRFRIQAIYALLIGVFILVFVVNVLPDPDDVRRILFLALSSIAFLISFYAFSSAVTLKSQLMEARSPKEEG